jgi:hypothetical protein
MNKVAAAARKLADIAPTASIEQLYLVFNDILSHRTAIHDPTEMNVMLNLLVKAKEQGLTLTRRNTIQAVAIKIEEKAK